MLASIRALKPECVMKVNLRCDPQGATSAGLDHLCEGTEQEQVCQDPKDGELCLDRVKSEETLMEARSGSDVQIDRRIWVQGRKTNRTIQQLVPAEVSLRIAKTFKLVL